MIIVQLTTTYEISSHHQGGEIECCSWRCVLDTTFCDEVVCDLQEICGFLRVLRFPPPIKLTAMIYMWNWNIVESGVKHHNPKIILYYDNDCTLVGSLELYDCNTCQCWCLLRYHDLWLSVSMFTKVISLWLIDVMCGECDHAHYSDGWDHAYVPLSPKWA